MISFEMPEVIRRQRERYRQVAEETMRPLARHYDSHEHAMPREYIDRIWPLLLQYACERERSPELRHEMQVHMVEMLTWGDAGMYLCTPGSGFGGPAIEAMASPEQRQRFLGRFTGETPIWGCLAMTEPHAGSDTAAIRTRAVRQGNGWILNGTKIYVTSGHKALVDSSGFVLVWATVDPALGHAGMRPFVVEAGTPGLSVVKLEKKMGIRASDTAAIVLENCPVPAENLLGGEDPADAQKAFKSAMAMFDATRPYVAANALGIARAALEFVREKLAENGVSIPYGVPRVALSGVQRDVLDMEAAIQAAWLLTVRAAWLADNRRSSTVAASMCKIKAGETVVRVTQKAVEILGPLGYSCDLLVEKWMRDARITDVYEGTGQINRLIVARRILGYTSKQLK